MISNYMGTHYGERLWIESQMRELNYVELDESSWKLSQALEANMKI